MSADRTCAVIQDCAENCQQFAFLELTKETINKSDPIHPVLRDSNGKFVKEFQERRKDIIGKFNICPIWYPNGMHTEALGAFFTKIAEDLNIVSHPFPAIDINYMPLHYLLGREDIVNSIVNTLSVKETVCVWVDGPGGIGKTEICKAVYAELKEKYPLSIGSTISRILYFDNWEDIWYGLVSPEEKTNLFCGCRSFYLNSSI